MIRAGGQALIGLHAAVASDLATRALPLSRLVSFTFARRFPALWMAQRIYQDGSRANEIIAENKVVHPAFVQATIEALSA